MSKISQIGKAALKATIAGKMDWEPTSDEDTYMEVIGDSVLYISETGFSVYGGELQFLGNEKAVSPHDLSRGTAGTAWIGELWSLASGETEERNQSLDDLLDVLASLKEQD